MFIALLVFFLGVIAFLIAIYYKKTIWTALAAAAITIIISGIILGLAFTNLNNEAHAMREIQGIGCLGALSLIYILIWVVVILAKGMVN